MSRFKKLAHVVWHWQYHIVWVPNYRYKVLNGKIAEEVRKTIIIQSERLK
ncbi:MAG: transposase [Methylococcales bacterium]|nr:transposase [Methylococcales bacterium]